MRARKNSQYLELNGGRRITAADVFGDGGWRKLYQLIPLYVGEER